jgi:glutamine amidotransferase
MSRVAIVNYGMCNLDSVARAVEECGGTPVVTDRVEDLRTAGRLILPGVGAFPDGMRNLHARGLDVALQEQAGRGVRLLGICLGMQLLATEGWEVSRTSGLGLIAGTVQRLASNGEEIRIPHIGWNEVDLVRPSPLFEGVASGRDFYFVHSYALVCDRPDDVLARTTYGAGFVSAVECGNVFGVQFHPEKSQKLGFQLLRNFLTL